jgi:glycosyltransferase involved in cell wall biosynthesis
VVVQLTDPVVDVLIPAHNAAASLPAVLDEIPARLVRSTVVIDAGSRDATAQIAIDRGAIVVRERRNGYGAACRRGVQHLESLPHPPDVVVFVAADGSDDPAELPALLAPIEEDNAELVVGVRPDHRGGSARVGVTLISALYRYRFEDLGPFRAIRFPALVALGLRDRGDGWHAEMQVKALKLGLQIVEVPVSYRDTHGRRSLGKAAGRAGRTLFQIIRHSTSR